MKKILLCVLIVLIPHSAWSVTIDSFSDMPNDSNSFLFDGYNLNKINYYNNPFSDYGINISPKPGYLELTYSFIQKNVNSPIAPFRSAFYAFDISFTSSEPVYAFGATFVAGDVPNLYPFYNYIKNVSTKVTAYDINDNVVEVAYSSSYGNVLGPVEFHTTPPGYRTGGIEFMASYAGFWTDIPVYKVTFTGIADIPSRSGWGSIAFSRTPRSVPKPPVANAGLEQKVELASSDGTEVTLDGSESTDPDSTPETNDDIVYFDWYKDDILLGSGESFVYTFPLGIHTVKLIVTDSAGESAEDEVAITIEDTTPPEVSISASPGTLWPPNGKMKDVLIQGEAADISGEVSLALLVEDEYGEINLSLSDFDEIIQLEAWRRGRDQDGRTYTINVIATDSSGNGAFASTLVIVPHDMGGGNSKK